MQLEHVAKRDTTKKKNRGKIWRKRKATVVCELLLR